MGEQEGKGGAGSMTNEKAFLKHYSTAISMWTARFDTFEIAERLGIPEAVVAKWVANFRELARAA
jgi:hypothetical protein